MKIPEHIAIIMDGNGRWALERKMKRTYGHIKGEEVFRNICIHAHDLGIGYLTVYAFSTENFKRSPQEVNAILGIIKKYLDNCCEMARENGFRIRVTGKREGLDDSFAASVEAAEKKTENNKGLNIFIAVNYGGRDEIIRSVNKAVSAGRTPITEDVLSSFTDIGSSAPPPDLLIRTGGEKRLSNFMLWDIAYTELYFTDVLWPDFKAEDLDEAIRYYSHRERRYGNTL